MYYNIMHINVVVLFGRRIITQSEPAIHKKKVSAVMIPPKDEAAVSVKLVAK